jgi:dolichol-phosphate mannosyltransferase
VNDSAWEIPEHDTHEFAVKRSRYCIVVFVINENGRLHAQLDKMQSLRDRIESATNLDGDIDGDIDIVVADGGSTDGSVAESALRSRGVNTLLIKTGDGRLGAQMRMAFAWALRRGYAGVITIDGNDKDDSSASTRFVAALDEGVDHVQGSRFVPGGREFNTPLSRLFAIKRIHAPRISRAAGFRYTDTTNGFRAYSRDFLLDPRVAPFRAVFQSYGLHYYLAVRAGELGFAIKEVPVTRGYPATGETPTRISPLRGNLEVMRILRAVCRHQFDPEIG